MKKKIDIMDFEEFKNKYPKRYPIFKRLNLKTDLDMKEVYTVGSMILKKEIIQAQDRLLRIGNEEKIGKIYDVIYYFMYLESRKINPLTAVFDIPLRHYFFDKFMSEFNKIFFINSNLNKGNFVDERRYSEDEDYAISLNLVSYFLKILKEAGFDLSKDSFSDLALILFWIRLESLLCYHDIKDQIQ